MHAEVIPTRTHTQTHAHTHTHTHTHTHIHTYTQPHTDARKAIDCTTIPIFMDNHLVNLICESLPEHGCIYVANLIPAA